MDISRIYIWLSSIYEIDISPTDFRKSRSNGVSNITKADAYTKALQTGMTATSDEHLSLGTVKAVHKVLTIDECPDCSRRDDYHALSS